jgi:hypothetical protein
MRTRDNASRDEEATQTTFDLYIPYWAEQNGPSQPLGTALPLAMGKNLCLQNFLQRCRTIRLGLPAEQQAEVSATAIEKLVLAWNLRDSGVFEGQPITGLSPLASLSNLIYLLQPVTPPQK